MRSRLPVLAISALSLAGCVAYTEPVAYVPPPAPPVYVAPPPPPVYAPPPGPPVYVAPAPPGRYWVPRRCDAWGRCWGGYWRYG